MRALITGAHGFVGQYLTEYLLSQNDDVWHLDGDIRDYENCRNEIDKVRPDHIFHLAAQAYVPESFSNPKRAFEVNTIGSLNILEAVRQVGIKTKVLLAGTSEEYGSASNNSEDSLPEPKSPYAIAKLAMDYLGRLYAEAYGMDVVVTRAFNHTGAGRGEMYAESSFAKQIALIEDGQQSQLKHGNLQSMRNYTDVEDIVKAYRMAIDLPSDVYNICSHQNYTMEDILALLCEMSESPINLIEDPSRMRPSDFSFARPSARKFQKLTGWRPETPIEETLESILDYWRERV